MYKFHRDFFITFPPIWEFFEFSSYFYVSPAEPRFLWASRIGILCPHLMAGMRTPTHVLLFGAILFFYPAILALPKIFVRIQKPVCFFDTFWWNLIFLPQLNIYIPSKFLTFLRFCSPRFARIIFFHQVHDFKTFGAISHFVTCTHMMWSFSLTLLEWWHPLAGGTGVSGLLKKKSCGQMFSKKSINVLRAFCRVNRSTVKMQI